MRAWSILLLCSLTLSAAAGEREPMRLCFAGEPCRDHECRQRVEPAPLVRLFQLTAADGTTRQLGVLGANETSLACGGEATLDIRVTARGLPRDGRIRVTIADEAKHAWDVVLRANDLKSRVKVTLAKGAYALTVASEHYRTIRKSVRAGSKPETVAAALEPLPILSGRVFARDSAAGVVGAFVSTNVETSAVADGTGAWSIESDPDQWPATMTVSAPGYAETTLPIPQARTSSRVEDVFLNRGGSVVVEAVAPEDAEIRRIELRKLRAGEMVGRAYKSIPVDDPSAAASVRFDGIEPGRYVVVAKGAAPFEQRGEPVEVREGEEKNVRVRISPIRLRIRTTMNAEPLAGARIHFKSSEGFWDERLESGPDGEVTVDLWQGGPVLASVFVDGLMNVPHLETHTVAEEERADWTIDVSARRITGVVVDAKSGAPVADAVIALEALSSSNGTGFAVRTRSDSEGRFRFVPVPYGRHTLTAAGKAHLQTSMSYTFAPPDDHRDVTVKLDGGATVRLRVLDAAGMPAVRAVALQYAGLAQTRVSITDDAGIAEIIVPEGQARDVYVVPREGSFGMIRVPSTPLETTFRLPMGASRIELRAESESHQPIPNVSVVMRFNRQLLPGDVVQTLGRIQGAWTWSHSDGRLLFDHMPAGVYEFWPAGPPAEMQLIAAGAGPQAPASMTVAPGENVAVLTFARVP